MSAQRCTVIIPTYNRPEELRHQLSFCSRLHRDLAIRVADGSKGNVAAVNRAAVLACDHPDIQWANFEDTHLWQRAVALLDECDTPYAMLCGDDDFLMPNGIRAALEFLETHPGHVAAQGITLGLPGTAADSRITWHLNSLLGALDAECPVERMAHHLAQYSHTCYAVHRTKVLRDGLHLASSAPFSMDTICLGELMQSIHTVLSGKVIWMDVPWLCRSPSSSSWPAALEIMRPEFSSCLTIIREMAVRHSGSKPEDLVRRLFDHAFSSYLVSSRFSLTASAYDFWPWRSPRAPVLKKPDLPNGVKRLKAGLGWEELSAEYPAATRQRSRKWWFGSRR